MVPLKVVIVEDEPLAVERLKLALKAAPDVEVVGAAHDGRQGLELIRSLKPDLVFLDIKMPMLDGIELADILAKEGGGPAVIFLTAFGQFAVTAFELAAVDYLMKPVALDRVRASVERARERIAASTAQERAADLEKLVTSLRREAETPSVEPSNQSLWVTDARGRVRVPLSGVDWLEAERDYVRIHSGKDSHLMRMTLQALAEKLDESNFFRVHRSAVVNLHAVTGLRRRSWGLVSVRLRSGAEVPVGRPQLRELKRRLGVRAVIAEEDA